MRNIITFPPMEYTGREYIIMGNVEVDCEAGTINFEGLTMRVGRCVEKKKRTYTIIEPF